MTKQGTLYLTSVNLYVACLRLKSPILRLDSQGPNFFGVNKACLSYSESGLKNDFSTPGGDCWPFFDDLTAEMTITVSLHLTLVNS